MAGLGASTWTALILIGLLLLWQLSSSARLIKPTILPGPASVATAFVAELGRGSFWRDLGRTLEELVLSFLGGLMLGSLAGWAFWKKPLLGRVFEPYLVAFYAVPLVVFYPISIVVIGINEWPIVLLAGIMTAIPIALNTWRGLERVRSVYLLLGASLSLSRRQMATKLLLPAAAPLIFAGIKLGAVYALIGTIAMEFLTASAGLGFQIRYQYEYFDERRMYAYILVVLILSVLLTASVELAERRVVGSR
ncbi:MAG: ABC transporter permease [Chloroflexota bacterium]